VLKNGVYLNRFEGNNSFILYYNTSTCNEIEVGGGKKVVSMNNKKVYDFGGGSDIEIVNESVYFVNFEYEIKRNNNGEKGQLVIYKNNSGISCYVETSFSNYYLNSEDVDDGGSKLIRVVSNETKIVSKTEISTIGYYINGNIYIIKCSIAEESEVDCEDILEIVKKAGTIFTKDGKFCSGDPLKFESLPTTITKYILCDNNNDCKLWNVDKKALTVINSNSENYLTDKTTNKIVSGLLGQISGDH